MSKGTVCRHAVVWGAVLILAAGCGSSIATRHAQFSRGSILVLPVQDATHGGVAHKDGMGSGEIVTQNLVAALQERGWEATIEEGAGFTHTQSITKEEALEAGVRRGHTYALLVELGEFGNSAPMSFRSDYATLQAARMYRCTNGETVWALLEPRVWKKGNIGNHIGLLRDIAYEVAKSVDTTAAK